MSISLALSRNASDALEFLYEAAPEANHSHIADLHMSRSINAKTKKSFSHQQFYHSEEVLNSTRFFLVGRGGHGNFHKGNRAVRALVADHAVEYVATPRKDRSQISIGLFDRHPMFQSLLFVTPRDYVLPRLEKDEDPSGNKHASKAKAQGMKLPNGTTIPPTLSSQKRWLSRTRTQSIIEEHGSINDIRAYPRGVYIEVGRDWAIDIIDHLCREQAHEIRKNKHRIEILESAEQTPTPEESSKAFDYRDYKKSEGPNMTADTHETSSTASSPSFHLVSTMSTDKPDPHIMELERARAMASPDMMEAVEGLSALMKSEGSTDSEGTTAKPPQSDISRDGYSDCGSPPSPLRLSEDDAIITTGSEILTRFPDDMHFVCGCVGFSVLDNPVFLKLIEAYYNELLESDASFRKEWEDKLQKLKVRRHVPAILARACEYARSIGKRHFRLWTAQRDETNGGRLQRLSEEVWSQAGLIEITENTALLKQRLESPLRSILMTLKRHPGFVKEGNGTHVSDVVDPIQVPQDSAQRDRSASGSDDRMPDRDHICSAACLESDSSMLDSRKRPISSVSESWQTHNDCRSSLPCINFDYIDLGEPPSGWLFCRERAINKLIHSTQVAVVVSNHHSEENGISEKHFVWEAAGRWRKDLPAKRFICWFDASSESSLCYDFERYTRGIRPNDSSDKKAKNDLVVAVQDFYQALTETRSGAEFFLVFYLTPDPVTFSSWVAPAQNWYDDAGNLLQDIFSAIVVVPKQQTPYRWKSDAFRQIDIHTLHRIPDKKWKDDKPWWSDLPLPNLPPMFFTEINPGVMEKVRQALEVDGSLVGLLSEEGGDHSLPSAVANQFVRKWIMEEPASRFGIWLSARSKETLRKSYIRALCALTRLDGFDDEVVEDIALRWLAKELMDLLMHMRKLSPKYQWVMVFSDIPSCAKFEDWFFPSESEWWNSRGRFTFTSSDKRDLEVAVGEDGADSLRKVPVVTVS